MTLWYQQHAGEYIGNMSIVSLTLIVTCDISLLGPTVCLLPISRSADVAECVFGVKSDSIQLMLAWGWWGVGDKGVGQNDDQSLWCPFLLITHYCATDLCQNSSSSSIEMCTKASINQEGYSSVWGCNSPHLLLFLLPVCLTGLPELKSCQPHCNWDEWRFAVVL